MLHLFMLVVLCGFHVIITYSHILFTAQISNFSDNADNLFWKNLKKTYIYNIDLRIATCLLIQLFLFIFSSFVLV